MNTIDQLIKEGYKLFSKYKAFSMMIKENSWCLYDNSIYELNNLALQDISSRTIVDYFDVILADTHARDAYDERISQMRFLLPRLLELYICENKLCDEIDYMFEKLHCDNPLWLPVEIDFLQRFATAYFDREMSESINAMIDVIMLFDGAKLHNNLTERLFHIILQNRHDMIVIRDMIYIVSDFICDKPHYRDGLDFNVAFEKFIHSDNFKNAFINAILNKIDDKNITQDEMNTYEVAFEVFSGL